MSAQEPEVMEVYGRDQLVAAILAVPHDGPVEIVLHRERGVTRYRFDYSVKTTPRDYHGRPLSAVAPFAMHPTRIDARLKRLAARVRKQPKELYK